MLDGRIRSTRERVTALVEALLRERGVAGGIGMGVRLVDAGLTSMDMVNLMLGVEAEFDILIPPEDITPANFRTVASVEALVDRMMADVA